MNPVPTFPSVADAMAAVQAGLRFVADADATRMSAQAQAECLQMMERANAIVTAARASVLSAFTSGQGYSADADYSPRAWLIHKTRVTKVVAVAHTAWAKRMVTHPRVMAALAAEDLSESYGRTICQWTDKLPEDCRPAADAILLSAAKAGMDLRDLAGLAAEMYERSRYDLPDEDPAQGFEDRAVSLEPTFQGAGSPERGPDTGMRRRRGGGPGCAGRPGGRGGQPHPCAAISRRAAGSDAAVCSPPGLLPERAGQPVKALVHVSLADLMLLDGSSALMEEWIAGVRAQWAAARAAASESGSDGGAWLDGDGARSFTCDASIIPVVTGEVNLAALEDLIRLCAELDKRRRAEDHNGDAGDPAPDTPAEEALEQAIIGKAVDLLSGPGGLASFLRRRQLGARLGGPSLPLDVGVSADIPAAIRRAVILRDQHCRFPGGCDQPASGCEVHHLRHRANGGPTSVKDCALFCFFHHQVVIHQWGWTVVLNPDGTTTAWNKDKTKIIHSHSPPVRPG